jgi:peptidoglycan/LPS O-acetylase OafA/YrhL
MAAQREQIGLTWIRGFAALWVVLYHFSGHFGTALNNAFVQRGHLGVDLFFVLSGFILFYVYIDTVSAGTFQYGDFLRKRFARIYPVHFVTMIAAFAILVSGSALGLSDVSIEQQMRALIPTALMLHAYGFFDKLLLNYPSWSISAEFFAYLLFAPVALMISHVRYPLLVGLTVFALFVVGSGALKVDPFELTNFSLPRILPEFILGGALFVACRRATISRGMLIAGLITALALEFGPNWMAVLGFVVLIAVLFMGDRHLTATGLRGFTHLGHISYSIYMAHGLIEMTGFKLIERAFGYRDGIVPVAFLLPMLALTILAGHLLHRWIEVPGRALILRERR